MNIYQAIIIQHDEDGDISFNAVVVAHSAEEALSVINPAEWEDVEFNLLGKYEGKSTKAKVVCRESF